MSIGVFAVSIALAGAACSSSSKTAAPTTSSGSPGSSGSSPATVPSATTIDQPVTYGYYDGHVDTMLSTDVSNKNEAKAKHINYSGALLLQSAGKFPSLYEVSGTAAPGQALVFGSEPGENDYSPLWHEITVKWNAAAKPVVLTSDNQINTLAGKHELTITPTGVVLNCPIVKVTTAKTVPSATTVSQPVTYGYYDGHVDTMLSTDVSNKNEAKAKHINYSGALLLQSAGKFPSLYEVSGTAAPGQALVFGSEPGENDYSPLWHEITVKWNAAAKPVVLTSDNQINTLAGKHELTITPTGVVLNCPIVKVTK